MKNACLVWIICTSELLPVTLWDCYWWGQRKVTCWTNLFFLWKFTYVLIHSFHLMEYFARNRTFCNVKREKTIPPQVPPFCALHLADGSALSRLITGVTCSWTSSAMQVISWSYVYPQPFPPGAEQAGTIYFFLTPMSWANAMTHRHLGHSCLAKEK